MGRRKDTKAGGTLQLNFKKFPKPIWRRFQAKAALRDISTQEALVEALERYTEVLEEKETKHG